MRTIPEIVADAGGVRAVADRVELTTSAIYKWSVNGVPDRFWAALIDGPAKTSPEELFEANRAARERSPSEAA